VVDASALAAEASESDMGYNAFAHTSPGMMAQFAIAGLMGAAGILVAEKQNRSLQRLLTVNLTRLQILIGHYLAMFVMIALQLIVLILFGDLALQLDYLSRPGATLAMTVVTAAFCASLGLLIGVLAKNEEQATIFALIPMFVLAGFGGAWVPLEITPQAFQRIASLTPLAWIVTGYKDILIRGYGVSAILPAVAAVAAYALVLFVLARWRFRQA
jgi:ABC-type multidrug transport system permease subunit